MNLGKGEHQSVLRKEERITSVAQLMRAISHTMDFGNSSTTTAKIQQRIRRIFRQAIEKQKSPSTCTHEMTPKVYQPR